MEFTTMPRVTRAISMFGPDAGPGEVAAGDPLPLLGEVDGQVLCFAGGRAGVDDLAEHVARVLRATS